MLPLLSRHDAMPSFHAMLLMMMLPLPPLMPCRYDELPMLRHAAAMMPDYLRHADA